MRTVLVKYGLFLILLGVIFVLSVSSQNQFRKMRTGDIFAKIISAVSASWGTMPLSEYKPAVETQKMFPKLATNNQKILDAWGNPIEILITEYDNKYVLSLVSAGPDGKMKTKDDYFRKIEGISWVSR